jgi:hypothetical protein
MLASLSPISDGPTASAVLTALAAAGQPRVLAHGAAGPWDEVILVGLVLAIVGAIWVFVRAGGDAPPDQAVEAEQPGAAGHKEEGL